MSGCHHTHNTTLENFQGPINTLAVAAVAAAAAAAGSELKGMMGNKLLARGSTDFNGVNPHTKPHVAPIHPAADGRRNGHHPAVRGEDRPRPLPNLFRVITSEEAPPPNIKTPFGDETVMECVAAPHTYTHTYSL